MVNSLRKLIKASMADYETKPREKWVTLHASQVCLFHTFIFLHSCCYNMFRSLYMPEILITFLSEMEIYGKDKHKFLDL